MNALAQVGNVIRCSWLRYEPQDDVEAYNDLLQPATEAGQTVHRSNSVRNVIAQFEQQGSNTNTTSTATVTEEVESNDTTCSEKAWSGASLLFGLFRMGGANTGVAEDNANDGHNNTQAERIAASVRAHSSKNPTCLVCQKKIFPTDESTTARNRTYHTSCFKCTLCKAKLKNHPDEKHELMGGIHLYLQCSRCHLDNQQKYKPRQLSRVAGEKIVVEDAEQGDIDQVVNAIGDELEEAIYAMIPRCATCGGDFLQYTGEVSIVGSLKYHKECFLTGKPGTGTASLTMDPVQAAKYLPQDIIMRLTSGSGKILTTLFFVWKDRDDVLKSLRSMDRTSEVSVTYYLDEEARANPNHPSNRYNKKKTMLSMPPRLDDNAENIDLKLDLVGGDQISPQSPVQDGAVSISSSAQNVPVLRGKMGYCKYNLRHSMLLQVPFGSEGDVMDLLGSKLTVSIQEAAPV